MSDQIKRLIEAVDRGSTALERIAAALELANYQRAFPPNVTVNPIPIPYYVGDPPPNQWPPNTYGPAGPPQTVGGDSGVITIKTAGTLTETQGGARG